MIGREVNSTKTNTGVEVYCDGIGGQILKDTTYVGGETNGSN